MNCDCKCCLCAGNKGKFCKLQRTCWSLCEGKEERVTVVVKSFAHLFLSIRREGSFLLECGERFFSFKSVYSRGTYIAT